MIERTCEHGTSFARGDFRLVNNLWGAATGRGRQCLWTETDSPTGGSDRSSPIAWGTEWSWEGDPDTVKSYVACTLGWHWGWPTLDGPVPGGPLPAALDDLAAVPTEWQFGLTAAPGARLNVTYDVWLAAVADPGLNDPADELMVWLRRAGDPTPIGRPQGSVEVAGATWELWRGPHPERGWTVHSFVRAVPADSTRLDLVRFFKAIRPSAPKAAYLVGVEAGTEVFGGSGRLDTRRYGLEIVRR
jgi:xyloglucan-specific endo-beta-1,4-glucanase